VDDVVEATGDADAKLAGRDEEGEDGGKDGVHDNGTKITAEATCGAKGAEVVGIVGIFVEGEEPKGDDPGGGVRRDRASANEEKDATEGV
jgi:hypothetical protein